MNEEQLILNNINLAYSIAFKYKDKVASFYEYEDLQQVCLEGLVRAAKTYDDTKGIAFSTYAYTVIHNNMITPYILNKNKTKGEVVLSLDENVFEDGSSLIEFIEDDVDIESDIVDKYVIVAMRNYINELPYVYRTIMNMRCDDKTFKQIADFLGCTEANVQKHYQKGLNMLRYKFKHRKGRL